MTREQQTGLFIVGGAALLLYFLSKAGLLHESVSSAIVSPENTVLSDPKTGFPQYDPRIPATIPAGEDFALRPISADGQVTEHPADPTTCTCPQGYSPYHNVQDDSYWCIPAG